MKENFILIPLKDENKNELKFNFNSYDLAYLDIIEKDKDDIVWDMLSCSLDFIKNLESNILDEFVKRFDRYINWESVSMSTYITEKIIDKYFDKLKLSSLMINNKMTENIIKKHREKITKKIEIALLLENINISDMGLKQYFINKLVKE